jgi:nucleoside-diphosphate-sugar epimerase
LIDRGHDVIGTATSLESAKGIGALGAEAVVLDLLDRSAVREAVLAAEPEAIAHQATALAKLSDFKHFDRSFAQTNRLRTRGTDNLLAAAREAGVRRFVTQSYATARYVREGGPVKSEYERLDTNFPKAGRESWNAMAYLDRVVTEAGGIALRYGVFYGDPDNKLVWAVRKRMFPIIGDGSGISSFIHLDDAAAATVLALEHDGPAIYNIVDDEPAPASEWLPEVARIVGAKPPRRFPVWLARLLAGEVTVLLGTEARGGSNSKAKRDLGWTLSHPSWRQGFAELYGRPSAEPAVGVAREIREAA